MDMNDLEDIKRRQRPFKVPEGYFSSIEDEVRERISVSEPSIHPLFSSLRSALALVCSFLLIFGVGYGVMALTGSMKDSLNSNQDTLSQLIDRGYIRYDFVDYLYDEISQEWFEKLSEDLSTSLPEEPLDNLEEYIPQEDLILFMETEIYK